MFRQFITKILFLAALWSVSDANFVAAQTQPAVQADAPTLSRYLDQSVGMTDDEAVRIALENKIGRAHV